MPSVDTNSNETPRSCPCGTGKEYSACCGPLHQGAAGDTAEAVMRSRYSAFALHLTEYLDRTWHPSTRPKKIFGNDPQPRWIGLRVRRSKSVAPDKAIVEFTARYELQGRTGVVHEISRFVQENGQWLYLDGKFPRR